MMANAKFITLQSVALPLIAVAGATAFFYYAAPIVVPVIIAVSLAYTLSPFVAFFDRLKFPHFLSVILLLLMTLSVVAVLGYLIFLQLNQFAGHLPEYWQDLLQLAQKIKTGLLGFQEGIFLEQLRKFDVSQLDSKYFAQTGQYVLKGLTSIFSLVFGSVLIFFLSFFILNDQKNIQRKLVRAFGSSQEQTTAQMIGQINGQIRAFIQVKFWTTVALTIVFSLGLLALGVDYPYIWGPLAGVLNLIPFVGSVLGAVPPVIVALVGTGTILKPLLVIIFFTAVQLLESNLVSPKIMGDKVNLSPLAVLVASMYWGWLWGGIGVILAVPITAALKVICDHIESLKPIGVLLGGRKD
jgi:predicted PurR-regulated permease PerM